MAKILIADDDRLFRSLVCKFVEGWGYEVEVVDDGQEAWDRLTSLDPPDLAILDWVMPGLDGVEICRRMRFRRSFQKTYLILLSARSGRQDVIAGLRSGADDYLTKPFDAGELEARLLVGMRSVELRTELEASRERLLREATHDSLTEILNRRGIVEALKREHARAAREEGPLSVALIDVDHFKKINDTYGHAIGDRVLIGIAERFSSSLRSYDAAGRFGGEEFLLVLPGTDSREAVGTIDRVRRLVAGTPIDCGQVKVPVTISAGVAAMRSAADDSADMLRRADDALYLAKERGRDRVESDEMTRGLEETRFALVVGGM